MVSYLQIIHIKLLGIIVLFFLSILNTLQAFEYTPSEIDSILITRNVELNDSNRTELLLNLSYQTFQKDYSASFNYAESALELAFKNDLIEQEMSAYNLLGSTFERLGDLTKGLEYKLKALELAEKTNNTSSIAVLFNNIGVHYYRRDQFQKALDYYINALALEKELRRNENIAATYLNIGEAYEGLKAYDKALYYEDLCIELSKNKYHDNLAFAYGIKGKVFKQLTQNDSAAIYTDIAIHHFKKAGDFAGMLEYSIQKGGLLLATKKLEEAKQLTLKILPSTKREQLPEFEKKCYYLLSEIYAELNSHKEAFLYRTKYDSTQKELLKKTKEDELAKMQTLYEVNKKNEQIKLLEKDQELQKRISLAYNIAFIIFLAFIAVLIFNIFQRKKLNKKLSFQNDEIKKINHDISAQNEEIAQQRDNLHEQKKVLATKNNIITEQANKITDSITNALRIQKAILPKPESFDILIDQYFIFYRPKDIVSGDLYWIQEVDKKLVIASVDCTGHGVSGAMMSMIAADAIKSAVVTHKILKPEQALEFIHYEIVEVLKQKESKLRDGMDMALVILDFQNKTLEYSGAKAPLLYIQDNTPTVIKGDKLPVGDPNLGYKRNFKRHTIHLKTPTTFYLYSDGYQDQFGGPQGRKFMSKKFRELLFKLSSLSMSAQQKHLINTFDDWKGNEEQVDDVLVLGIKTY